MFLFCFVFFFIFQDDTSLFLFNLIFKNLILHTFFHNYDNYSMFRDVPQCSMFQVLSTTINNKVDYVFF